ncbi:GDSL-type esterase/lipase family protein [Polynucleobacter necessarius]|uniref:GDSL-type esterase/lipase family protein n=1 Tax=Polynucleobacter necessarius TaxID=576610 RepID=UPI001E3342DA|nr:GDSL-type esterase/lipase family protein [Polynucleobacter necessarius]
MNQMIGLNFLSKKRSAISMAFALFCLLIPFGAYAQTNPTILLMGDSLSAEYGLARGTGWVRLLEDQLRKEASSWRVLNASISGETSSGGLTRLPKLFEQKRPGIVLLELGENDALRGLSIQETEKI